VQRLGEFFQEQAGPTFFATTGTRILRGRGIGAEDRRGAPLTMVVSDAMSKKLWPGQDAIGKCVRMGADTTPCTTVIGIAENIKQQSLGDDPGLTYYQAFEQTASGLAGMFVRTRGSAEANMELVRRHLQQVMPGTGYVTVTPMTGLLARQERSWELGATMFAVFGSLALVLAGIGLYGVIAFSVAERTHEMGVRIALGARVANVVSLIVRDALRVVLAGLGIGLAISLAAGRWVAPLLFQVSPRDPVVFGAVTLMLVCVALAASWIPAVRASRVDPSVALRAD
jgi:putative ABC transport system permease protein